MEPTTEQLNNRQAAIRVDELENQPEVNFNTFNEPPIFPVGSLKIPELETPQQKQVTNQAQSLSDEITQLTSGLLGESEFQSVQEEEQNIPEQLKQFTELSSELKTLQNEALAIPIQTEQDFVGRGATRAGIRPIETGRLRENAIKTLTINSQLEAVRGNIVLAQSLADRAVAQKFDPIKERLKVAQTNLEVIKDSPAFTEGQKNRALETELAIQERLRIIEKNEVEEKAISNISLIALQNGAPNSVAKEIQEATTVNDAYLAASKYMQSPEQKANLEKIRLDNILTKAKIQQTNNEMALFTKYGGLTPSEYLKEQEKEIEKLKKDNEQIDQARENAILLDTNIKKVDAVLNSRGLDNVVGPNILSRGSFRQKEGVLTKTASFLTGGLLRGVGDEISGRSDDIVALTQQMIDDQFLNKLIDVKAQGATFGALSDNEGQALRNAANAIAQTAIKDGEKVVGYDMSESRFKSEMQIIQDMTRRAYEKATGQLYTPDEEESLDELFNQIEFNPAF